MYSHRNSSFKRKNYYKKPFIKTKGFYILIGILIFFSGFIYLSIKKTDSPTDTTASTPKYTDQDNIPSLSAKLTSTTGKIELKTLDNSWQEIGENYQIQTDNYLRTDEDTKAIIKLPDNSIIRMNGNSEIKFNQISMADIVIEQISGSVFHRINDKSPAIYKVTNGETELTALGTAFNVLASNNLTILTVTENRVKAKIIDGDNIINMRTVTSGTQATINPNLETDKMIKTKNLEISDLMNNEWIVWNMENDKEKNFFLGIFEDTVLLNITKPTSTNSTTEQAEATIKGTTDPQAEIFMEGTELDNNNGIFETKVPLSQGENKFTITVKVGKKINKKTITIESTKPDGDIKLEGNLDENNVNLSWTNNESEDIKEFKILHSQSATPEYPSDNYHTINYDVKNDSWNNLSNGTHYFRVCAFSKENKCLYYSNDYKIEITDNVDISGTLNLQASQDASNVNLSWTFSDNLDEANGFKSIIAQNKNPVYPGNSYHSLNLNQLNDSWHRLSPGTYYFRVCLVKDDECIIYSNNQTITIKTEDLGSISLNGGTEGDGIVLNWIAKDLKETSGFKVFMHTQPNISTTNNTAHHLILDKNGITDTWTDLETGQTYYFIVCQNLVSTIGVCSDAIDINY